jgi:hypothetical protein
VRQVIEAARRVTGRDIPYEVSPRLPGDPAVLVASSERAPGAGMGADLYDAGRSHRNRMALAPRVGVLSGLYLSAEDCALARLGP